MPWIVNGDFGHGAFSFVVLRASVQSHRVAPRRLAGAFVLVYKLDMLLRP